MSNARYCLGLVSSCRTYFWHSKGPLVLLLAHLKLAVKSQEIGVDIWGRWARAPRVLENGNKEYVLVIFRGRRVLKRCVSQWIQGPSKNFVFSNKFWVLGGSGSLGLLILLFLIYTCLTAHLCSSSMLD